VVLTETSSELRAVAAAATDAAGFFPALYSRVTAEVAVGIEEGRFEDGERMEHLAVTFAGYYLRAERGHHGGGAAVPRCWRASWDVATDVDLVIVQHLLLGINAHVNHDLAQAVVEVAPAHGGVARVRADFDAVNDVLAGSLVNIMGDLGRVSRWTARAATWGGGRVFNFSLRAARDQAWCAAEQLDGLDEVGRRVYVSELDRLVSVVAYTITRPPLPFGPLLRLARRGEEQDPRAVTATLLGDPEGAARCTETSAAVAGGDRGRRRSPVVAVARVLVAAQEHHDEHRREHRGVRCHQQRIGVRDGAGPEQCQRDGGRHQHCAGHLAARAPAVASEPHPRHHRRGHPDRHLHELDPRPIGKVQDQPGDGTEGGHPQQHRYHHLEVVTDESLRRGRHAGIVARVGRGSNDK
jgi:hypothetical protein